VTAHPGRVTPGHAGVHETRAGMTDAHPAWLAELSRLDTALYTAVARTPTPALDRGMRRLSRAADHSKLWVGTAAVLTVGRGADGRRAAVNGLASVAVTSALVNAVLKPLSARRRPDREQLAVPGDRYVAMPRSTSFPSGHAASASAFASGVATAMPEAGIVLTGIVLTGIAAVVAYSRVHTGVHYPGDVVAGTVAGASLSPLVVAALGRGRRARGRRRGGLGGPG